MNGRAAAICLRPIDLIHERPHKENAAATRLKQIGRIGRIGYVVDVEPAAMVAHGHFKTRLRSLKPDLYRFRFVKPVPMLDGIRNRLAHGKVDRRDKVVAQTRLSCEIVRSQRRLINGFNAARQIEFFPKCHN